MKRKSIIIIAGLILVVLAGLLYRLNSSPSVSGQIKDINIAPTDTVNQFIETAVADDRKAIINFARPLPDQFFECLYQTPQQCADQRKSSRSNAKLTADNAREGVALSLGKKEISKLLLGFAENLRNRRFKFNKIISQRIAGNEARIRIDFNSPSGQQQREFLLIAEKEKWMIFDIVDCGRDNNFAPSES